MNTIIKMSNISKVFPPDNIALDNVTIKICEGEVHSIIGENGAGKSTIMKILYGIEEKNSGSIHINEILTNINSPEDANKNGIGMVHQELMLIDEFSIIENIVLGQEKIKNNFSIDYTEDRKKIEKIAKQMKLFINLDTIVDNLSIADKQKVEIIKVLYRESNVLILDEPTAVLTPQETDELFVLLNNLKNMGKTIIFISHKLDEVIEISDKITVFRKGKHVWTKPNVDLTKSMLASAMVGRDVLFKSEKEEIDSGKVVLKINQLSDLSDRESVNVRDINFDIRENEILGVAAISGNGQQSLVESIVGLANNSGEVIIRDTDISNYSIHKRREFLSYVSEDRKKISSSQNENLIKNIFMTHHYINKKFTSKFNILRHNEINNFVKNILLDFQVNTNDSETLMQSLSGGNQQKVILGREIELDRPLIIIDEPVRGLDVGSIEYVHKRILEQRKSGKAILLISSDLDEIMNLSDRIIILYKGLLVKELITKNTNKEEIGEYMLGVKS